MCATSGGDDFDEMEADAGEYALGHEPLDHRKRLTRLAELMTTTMLSGSCSRGRLGSIESNEVVQKHLGTCCEAAWRVTTTGVA